MTHKSRYLRAVEQLQGTDRTYTGGITVRHIMDHLDVSQKAAQSGMNRLMHKDKIICAPEYCPDVGATTSYSTPDYEGRGGVDMPEP